MNEDRMVGAGRNMLGKGERAIGETVGSERLQGDGVVDQVTGAIQHGFGKARGAVSDLVDDTPGALGQAADRGRQLIRRGDDVLRQQFGDNGPTYALAAAIALVGLGLLAVGRRR